MKNTISLAETAFDTICKNVKIRESVSANKTKPKGKENTIEKPCFLYILRYMRFGKNLIGVVRIDRFGVYNEFLVMNRRSMIYFVVEQ